MDQSALLDVLEHCERAVWDALVTGDQQADAAALHPDFLGVYADGFAGKADHVRQLDRGPTVARYRLSDLRVLPLGGDHAVLSYRADFFRTGHADEEAMFVSSIWQRAGQGWVNVISQDTAAHA